MHKTFEAGTWGGEIRSEFAPQPGEIVALEHWGSSGFASTDLDSQLTRHGIHQLIVIGLIAHTCVESTVRFAAELGYEVTVVKDATASYSEVEMHAALDVNIPNYATAVVTTKEIVDSIATLMTSDPGVASRQVTDSAWACVVDTEEYRKRQTASRRSVKKGKVRDLHYAALFF
jgi:hypothetical protein